MLTEQSFGNSLYQIRDDFKEFWRYFLVHGDGHARAKMSYNLSMFVEEHKENVLAEANFFKRGLNYVC